MPEEKSPLPHGEEPKSVVWTPEDASRFLTAAIHEAQRPLAEALKHRPVTSKALAVLVALLVLGAAAIGLILSSQLEKSEKVAAEARQAREVVLTDKAELQAKSSILEERLNSANMAITGMRNNEGELKRTKTDLQRSRRQNELLRNQIAGLEMEKMALARQLEAVKAMALDQDIDPDLEATEDQTTSSTGTSVTASSAEGEPREDATTAVSPGDGFRGAKTGTTLAVPQKIPETTEEATPPASVSADPGITSQTESPAAPIAAETPAPEDASSDTPLAVDSPAAAAEIEKPLEPAEGASDTATPQASITSAEEQESHVTTSPPASENPLTLYEASQLFGASAEAYGETLAQTAAAEVTEPAASVTATVEPDAEIATVTETTEADEAPDTGVDEKVDEEHPTAEAAATVESVTLDTPAEER